MQIMNKLILSAITLFGCCLCSCGQQDFKTVDADEFEKAVSTDTVQLVDVRTAEEFNEGHIASTNVKNIDVKQADFIQRADSELDKGKTVAVYCRSGKRSADAAGQLTEIGFKVINLDGGILEWQKRSKATAR